MSRCELDGRTTPRGRGPAQPGRPGLRRACATLLASLTVLATAPSAAGATIAPSEPVTTTTAPTEPTTAGPRLLLTGLQAVVGASRTSELPEDDPLTQLPTSFASRVLIENPLEEPLEGVDLVVEVYDRATSRSGLRAAIEGAGPVSAGGSRGVVVLDESLEPVAAGGVAQLDLRVDAVEHGLVDSSFDVTVRPVVVSLVRGSIVLDEVRTTAIGVARPIVRPLETTLVLPLDGPAPALDVQRAASASMLLPGGRLDRLLQAGEAAPPGTVTLAPAPHAIEDLTRLAEATVPGASDVLARVRELATGPAGIVSSPYALADVPALAAGATTQDLATEALVAGRQRLLRLIGQSPGASHLVTAPQTSVALDLAPVDVLVTPWDAAAGPDLDANPTLDIPPALRSGRAPSGRSLDVLVGDPWVASQLALANGRHGWAVDAHRVVAESAITFAQQPGTEGRAFAVLPPTGWDAPGRLAEEVVTRLAVAPWLRLSDPATVAARAQVTAAWTPLAEPLTPYTPVVPQVGALGFRLTGLEAAVLGTAERPDVVQRDDDLLRAVTTWPSVAPVTDARDILDDVGAAIDATVGEILVPDDSVITLASERGTIPVTVQHPAGVPLDVVVSVTTQGRLTFDDGSERQVRLEEGGTATVSFPATALGRGTFPLAVTVRTPGSDVVLARALVSVRATAVSRPALIAVGVVVLLLLVLGRMRRPGRRDAPPRLEVVR